jgi:hypothetical protein
MFARHRTERHDPAFDQDIIEQMFAAPGSEEWDSWDDAFQCVKDHPDLVGGRAIAQRLMEALDCTQRHGVPFTRDVRKALEALQRHAGPIEAIPWRRM